MKQDGVERCATSAELLERKSFIHHSTVRYAYDILCTSKRLVEYLKIMQQAVDTNYVIPAPARQMGAMRTVVLVCTGLIVIGGALGYLMGNGRASGLAAAVEGAITAAVLAVALFFVCAFALSMRAASQLKANWARHSFDWYRASFPTHAHANGHVSCRHCGSHKTNVRNLMQRTLMRVHSCNQCGKTLYFSPEQV